MSILRNNKTLLLIGVSIALIIVVVLIGITLIGRNNAQKSVSNNSSLISSSQESGNVFTNITTSSTSSSDNTKSSNTASLEMDMSSSSLQLPKVTLSQDPIDKTVANNTSLSSSSSISNISTSKSSTKSSTVTISQDLSAPQNVMVVNKDYKKWSVFWTTKKAVIGKLKYGVGVDEINKTLSDDRATFKNKASYTHFVTITNDDQTLNNSNPKFYYILVSDSADYLSTGAPYEYQNVELLSTPSSPTTATISLTPKQSDTDLVALARIKSGSNYSEWVGSVVDSSSVSLLPIGTARNTSLNGYVSTGGSSTLEVKVYGKQGNVVATKTNQSLTKVDEDVYTLTVTNNTVASASSTRSTNSTTSSTQRSVQTSSSTTSSQVATSTSESEEEETTSSSSSLDSIPKTAIGDDITLSIIALGILFLGTTLSIFYKKSLSKTYLKAVVRKFED